MDQNAATCSFQEKDNAMNSAQQTDGQQHTNSNTANHAMPLTIRLKALLQSSLAALCITGAAFSASANAYAHQDASAASAVSMLPVASLLVGGSAVAGSIVAVPVALSASGTVLIVKTVESTARGTVLVLERVSDGARVSLEIVGDGLAAASVAVGATITVSVIAAGCILSSAGDVIAFVPNKLGQSLLHNQQVTY
jgi:hypothetical protein